MRTHFYRGSLLPGLVQVFAFFTAVAQCADPMNFGGNNEQQAAALVRRGLDAEILGDAAQRHECLANALTMMPQHQLARWQSGFVQIGDEWLKPEDLERQNFLNNKRQQYRQYRDQLTGTLAGEIQLARFCREQKFEELEKYHWVNVLRFDNTNTEARGRLGVREYGGLLLTNEQIQQYRDSRAAFEKSMSYWKPRFSKWRAEIEGSDPAVRVNALNQLREVSDVSAIPAMVQTLSSAGPQISLEVIGVLSKIDESLATEILLRYALIPDDESVRKAAAESLKSQSWFAIIPSLLGSMSMPTKLSYSVQAYDYSVGYQLRLIRENRTEEFTFERDHSIDYTNKRIKPLIRQEKIKYRRPLDQLANEVEDANERVLKWNQRVCELLRTITDQKLDDNPENWWKWWEQWNELERYETKVETHYRRSTAIRFRPIRGPFSPKVMPQPSCFLAGTNVWTDLGAEPIEKIRIGDRVLAQDPESGELTYQFVLGTTVRPPSPSLRIAVGDEEIATTPGHPFWVVGKGWLMAKQLKVGQQLHSPAGGVSIEYIEKGPESEAYNLVVDNFNTYFVGKQRVLVHDNLARSPIELPLPGYPAE